jgi:predicted RNA-binding protein associated with RNAse of E/G family
VSAERDRLTYHLIRLPDRSYTFEAELLHADAEWLAVRSRVTPSRPLAIDSVEVLADGYEVEWFLFKGRPWDVGRVYRPDGTFTGFYADILEPVRWEGDDPTSLEPLVDLFLDLWVGADGRIAVLDEDELAEALTTGSLTRAQASDARSVLAELEADARAGRFPPPLVRDYPAPSHSASPGT